MEALKNTAYDVPIAGIQPFTTIDFPGKIAAVFFTQGCPWHCRYCHNADLRLAGPMNDESRVPRDSIESFLSSRTEFLEGIVVSGGEPTIHTSLPYLLSSIKEYGYDTALHTNGDNPEMLGSILRQGLVDYVAMDVKAPPAEYDRITRCTNTGISATRSISKILSSKVDYEFRTTYHPSLLTEEELMDTVHAVYNAGARKYYIQRFTKKGVRDEELMLGGDYVEIPDAVVQEARKLFNVFDVR